MHLTEQNYFSPPENLVAKRFYLASVCGYLREAIKYLENYEVTDML